MHGHLSQVPRLLSLQVVQALLPRQSVSAQDPSICYGCVTWCLGSRSPCGHIWGLWDQASFGDDCQLWIWRGSSDTKVAPTVVQQQQRQEDRHPLLLDAPVSHGELAQGMCKQALQSKWPVTLCWAPAGRVSPQQGDTRQDPLSHWLEWLLRSHQLSVTAKTG